MIDNGKVIHDPDAYAALAARWAEATTTVTYGMWGNHFHGVTLPKEG